MPQSLFRIAYFSRSTIGPDPADQAREIGHIVASARRNNLLVGVTGALLFSHGCFAQVLEGAREDVDLVFERVRGDRRHRDLRILQQGPVSARSFGDWWMAYAGTTSQDGQTVSLPAGIFDPQDILASQSGRILLQCLRELVSRDDEARIADTASQA